MADTGDVETALVALLDAALYPSGDSNPSVIGSSVNIARGWPTEADLRAAVSNGSSLLRVYGIPNLSKDDTRYQRVWRAAPSAASTLTATLSGFTVTFSGTPAVGQFVGILSKGNGYSYPVQSTDTLSSVATAFAVAIPGASSLGAVLTLPTGGALPNAAVQMQALASLEVGRECQEFVIASWAPTPQIRDALLSAVHPAIGLTYHVQLLDAASSIATLMELQTGGPSDSESRASMWRRDLRASYDFPITAVQTVAPVTSAEVEIEVEIEGNVVSTTVAETV